MVMGVFYTIMGIRSGTKEQRRLAEEWWSEVKDDDRMRRIPVTVPLGITYKLLIIRLWCGADFYYLTLPRIPGLPPSHHHPFILLFIIVQWCWCSPNVFPADSGPVLVVVSPVAVKEWNGKGFARYYVDITHNPRASLSLLSYRNKIYGLCH